MAGDAVERCFASSRRVLLTMALDAPPHRQGSGGRAEAHEPEQVVPQLRSRVRADHPHSIDRAVARLTLEPEAHVGSMWEEGELRKLEDAHPGDRLAALGVVVDLRDLGIVLGTDNLVATQATLDRRKPCVLRSAGVSGGTLARGAGGSRGNHVIVEG